MNRHQRVICDVARCDIAADKRGGIPPMDFRNAKKIAREVHKGQSIPRMRRYINFVEVHF